MNKIAPKIILAMTLVAINSNILWSSGNVGDGKCDQWSSEDPSCPAVATGADSATGWEESGSGYKIVEKEQCGKYATWPYKACGDHATTKPSE